MLQTKPDEPAKIIDTPKPIAAPAATALASDATSRPAVGGLQAMFAGRGGGAGRGSGGGRGAAAGGLAALFAGRGAGPAAGTSSAGSSAPSSQRLLGNKGLAVSGDDLLGSTSGDGAEVVITASANSSAVL